LVTHRKRLIQQRTQARNRLHGVLHRHNLTPPEGKIFGPEQRAWWKQLDLTPIEKLRVQQDLTLLDTLDILIAAPEPSLRKSLHSSKALALYEWQQREILPKRIHPRAIQIVVMYQQDAMRPVRQVSSPI